MQFNPLIGKRTLEIAAQRWGHIPADRRFRAPDGRRQRYLKRTHRATGAEVLTAVKIVNTRPRPRRKPPAAEMPLAA